jgi:hypothetical protein
MNLGSYRFNIDALLARIFYRWRGRSIVGALLLVALSGFGSGVIPPFWRGGAQLTIVAPRGATVTVDGQSWPHPVYAGRHFVRGHMPDGRGTWADIVVDANQALTLTLPLGLLEPRERALPPAAPGAHIDQVWWADSAWRVVSVQDAAPQTSDPRESADAPTATPRPGQTVAVTRSNMERLATLDAYAGLADQVHVGGASPGAPQLIEAVYRTNTDHGFSDISLGSVEVRGWSATVQTLPISSPLTLLRFSPDGSALLAAERVPSGGEQVYLIRPGQARIPIVAVPGRIARLSWRPDSRAVVIHSIQEQRLTLTLVRLAPTIIAAAVADLDAARYASAIVPLTWDDAGLLWVAPDQQEVSTLWSAPLASLIPEHKRPLEARALTCLADGTLRVAAVRGERVVIGRYAGDIFVGETAVPRVAVAPDLMGIWQDDELLLQGGGRAWLLDVTEGANEHG